MSVQIRADLEPAYILHHRAYRDSSLLLEVFFRDYGRIGLVARGARSRRSRWRGQLQVFMPLLLSWRMRGELGTLTGVDNRGAALMLAGRHLLSAYYMNELLLRMLTRSDPHPGVFVAYEQALHSLGAAGEPALRIFEKRLLQELGYGLLLDHEAGSGKPVDANTVYEYHLEKGPVKRTNEDGEGLFLSGASLIALHNDRLADPAACQEIKRLMRAALALYLGPRPLRTRQVLQQFSRLADTGHGPTI